VLCFSHTDNDDHGGCRGNTVRALARWQHLEASRQAAVAINWAMLIAFYIPGGMVIKFAIELGIFVNIIDKSAARK
jgi:hypothetical protein